MLEELSWMLEYEVLQGRVILDVGTMNCVPDRVVLDVGLMENSSLASWHAWFR